MKTYFLTILFLCISATLQTACQQAQPIQLRVMTYNIHHGRGMDGEIDLERIARVIRDQQPDIVALQEVDNKTTRSNGINQAEILGLLTGMDVAFGKAMDYANGEYGEAILSRYEIIDAVNHSLPNSEGREPRAAIAITISPFGRYGERITILGTHLDHLPDDSNRMLQAKEIQQHIAKDTLMIFMGDLNDTPESNVIKYFLNTWTDAWMEGSGFSFPSEKPDRRIDYIMYLPHDRFRVADIKVIDERVASDHRPVIAVLKISP